MPANPPVIPAPFRIKSTPRDAPCCTKMREQLEIRCPHHETIHDCPDAVVVRTSGGYGLSIKDGSASSLTITYCPFCGKKLPNG